MRRGLKPQDRLELGGANLDSTKLKSATGSSAALTAPSSTVAGSFPRGPVPLAIDVALVLLVAASICFFDLNSPSINYRDETTHIRAIQEMRESGNFWTPTVRGTPYFNKPPLKMWLTYIPLAIFGESAFSYRFLDALGGMLTALALFVFARARLQSRVASVVAPLALLSCQAYIFGHGVRKAVQDSFLILFSTVAMLIGFTVIELIIKRARIGNVGQIALRDEPQYGLDARHIRVLALLCGASIGCAILTKSAAGVTPIAILGATAIVTGVFRASRREWLPALLWAVVPLIAIPGAYYIPHFLFTDGALDTAFGQEIATRVTTGYHNRDAWWFYLERLFVDRQGVPPELILLGCGTVVAHAFRRRTGVAAADQALARFLFLWVTIPVVVFSIIPSRLTWYISPAFPGMALAAAWFTRDAFTLARPLFHGGAPTRRTRTLSVFALLAIFVGGSGMLYQFALIRNELQATKPRHHFDLTVRDILRAAQRDPDHALVASFRAPELGLDESTYGGMIHRLVVTIGQDESGERIFTDPRFGFLITDLPTFERLASTHTVSAYRYFPASFDRKQWMVIASLRDQNETPALLPAGQVVDFGYGDKNMLFGFGGPSQFGKVAARDIKQSLAAMTFEGSPALKHIGGRITINMVRRKSAAKTVSVTLNGRGVIVAPMTAHFMDLEFEIEPDGIQNGTNVLGFDFRGENGETFDDEPIASLNWVAIRLRSTGSISTSTSTNRCNSGACSETRANTESDNDADED